MFLKSLELNGFKSFAQKTVLEFPKGITAIVGPNGSGKSNVIDAIRWILGERDAKNLRGAKAEDLIFAGTPKRPRSGMAQVSINFDNPLRRLADGEARFFPVELDEVSISREITRDSNSIYHLNKSEVRAKDVVDFFARARLGTRGITIINQGSSDMFVRATSQERRAMIEEVLGLKEYQLKKAEAQRKLKTTTENSEKARLMADEVLPRLRMLKRQVAKYQTLDEKRAELASQENIYFSSKISEIRTLSQNTRAEINDFDSKINEKKKELGDLEAELKKIEGTKNSAGGKGQEALYAKERELFSQKSALEKDLGRLEAKIEILSAAPSAAEDLFKKEEAIFLLRSVRADLDLAVKNGNWEKIANEIKNILGKIDTFFSRQEQKETKNTNSANQPTMEEKNAILDKISQIDTQIRQIRQEQQNFTKGLEEFNNKFKAAYSLVENKKEEIRKIENQRQYIAFEEERTKEKMAALKAEWAKTERSAGEFENLMPEKTEGVNISELENKIFKLRAEILAIGEVDSSLLKEAQEVEAHYGNLTAQLEDLEKATHDLENLIDTLKKEVNNKFASAFKEINEQFNHFFKLMFNGGSAKMKLQTNSPQPITDNEEKTADRPAEAATEEQEAQPGIDIELTLPKKRIHSLDMLSGGEKSLVSIAALFALISVSPPPFLVLDEIDAPLDEKNSTRFSQLIKDFVHKVQFVIVTHNRTIMEAADVLYGVTMNEDGTSKLVSLKFGD